MNEEFVNDAQDQLNKCPVSIEVFDGHCFERFSIVDKEWGLFHCSYKIDGIEASEPCWIEQRRKAMIRDMVSFNIKLLPPDD